MAIYRGTGGAGDATTDATVSEVTEQAVIATNKASEAAASATAAANSESSASSSATAAANSAANAASAASDASDDAAAAEAAKLAAQAAQAAAETAETNAETAETNAETAESNAASSASAAATSATNASNSSSSASLFASNAADSSTAAASSASSAATSATSAATSAGTATTQATAAAASASAASTSETNAATSASNASASETAASASETAAASSATSASTSATNAATSATNASNSASAASTSASNASTSESNAATSASNAATSESNASSSATAAAGSATAAAGSASAASASADAALAALDNFDDRYLGQKATAPTVDNDGDALVTGALYFDTTDDAMKVWDGTQWLAAYASLSGALIANNNLSDLSDASAARTNLGLGTAATTNSTAYATAAQGTLADSALQNVSEDTTPQLGGDLDTNGNDIAFGDNDKATFGASSDLQIYHNGSNSYIQDNGTGNLYIQGTQTVIKGNSSGQWNVIFADGGDSIFYHSNVGEVARTKSTGVDVTGTVTADGIVVDGAAKVLGSAANTLIIADASETNGYQLKANTSASVDYGFVVENLAGKDLLKIESNNDISFYEDTGTTAKFFWDASAESLELGTSSSMTPTASLAINEVTGGTPAIEIIPTTDENNDTTASIRLWGTRFGTANRYSEIKNITDGATANNELAFDTNGSERMRIDSSGRVGIGTTSPTYPLTVYGSNPDSEIVASFGSANDSGEYTAIGLSGFIAGNDATKAGLALKRVGTFGTGELHFLNNNTLNDSDMTLSDSKMMIDSSGRIGIGTTSPSEALEVNGKIKADTHFTSSDSNATLSTSGSGGTVYLRPNGSSTTVGQVIVDSSGRIGIGTASPTEKLQVDGTAKFGLLANPVRINSSAATGILEFSSTGSGTIRTLGAVPLAFQTNSTERMRIDSSGNLLVGTTNIAPYATSNTTGLIYRADFGLIGVSRDSNYSGSFNRYGTDGAILNFRKDGTTVGSIGSEGGDTLYIGTGDTGLRFHSADRIVPHNPATNTSRDAAIDLGRASERFKDLYLSGGIYLGGTGDANKLDDYEEGTWTPEYIFYDTSANAYTDFPSVTYDRQSGYYTKVGNLVTAVFSLRTTSLDKGVALDAETVYVDGLPFSPAAVGGAGICDAQQNFVGNAPSFLSATTAGTIALRYLNDDAGDYYSLTVGNLSTSANGNRILNCTLTYRTDA
jgi:hypothetical protein